MIGRGYFRIYGCDFPIRSDQDRNAGGTRRVRFGSAVSDRHRLVGVAQQIVRKVELIFERKIVGRAVHTAAEDDGVLLLEILDSITEPIAFDRSPRGIGLRIPPDQNVFSRMVGKRNVAAFLVRDAEGRGLITNVDHGHYSLFATLVLLRDSRGPVHEFLGGEAIIRV